MDGISRSCGSEKEILHGFLPMGQLILSEKWVKMYKYLCPSEPELHADT